MPEQEFLSGLWCSLSVQVGNYSKSKVVVILWGREEDTIAQGNREGSWGAGKAQCDLYVATWNVYFMTIH